VWRRQCLIIPSINYCTESSVLFVCCQPNQLEIQAGFWNVVAGNTSQEQCHWNSRSWHLHHRCAFLYRCKPSTITLPVTAFHNLFTSASLSQLLYQCQPFTKSLPGARPSKHLYLQRHPFSSLYLCLPFTISSPVPTFHNLFTSTNLSQSLHQCQPFTISLPVPAFHNLFTSASLSQSLFQCQPSTISSVPVFHNLFTSVSLSQSF
jgi:hypothetical protein